MATYAEPLIDVFQRLPTLVRARPSTSSNSIVAEAKRQRKENLPKNELLALIMKRKFREATQRVNDFPREAECIGSHGDTALHLACNIYPEVPLVKALLSAYPSATQVRNGFGCAPLHVACRGSSDEVVRLLLEVDPTATKVQNKDGNQPLELLCWPRFERKVITDALGRAEICEGAISQQPAQSPESLLRHDPQLKRIWRSARYLVEAESTGRVTKMEHDLDDSFLMVHACAQSARCPVNLLLLAVKLLPSQLGVVDSKGMAPIHYMIRDEGMPWKSVVELAFRTCPGAVIIQDPKTCLYPFMSLAAKTRAPLQSVFETLKACPELDRMDLVSR
jgi:hypothetical protein